MRIRITLDNGDFIEQDFDNADDMATEVLHWSRLIRSMGEKLAIEHLKTTAAYYASRRLEREVPAERV